MWQKGVIYKVLGYGTGAEFYIDNKDFLQAIARGEKEVVYRMPDVYCPQILLPIEDAKKYCSKRKLKSASTKDYYRERLLTIVERIKKLFQIVDW